MYEKPTTLEDAISSPSIKSCTILAGGTDIIPLIKNGVKEAGNYLDITHIPQLHELKETSEGWFIGAANTLTDIANTPVLNELYPAICQAAKVTASPQIRNMGTIGGNILQDRRCIYFNQSEYWRSSIDKCFKTGGTVCHQIPNSPVCRALYYSDVAPALYVYHAKAVFYKDGEKQILPIEDFVCEHSVRNGTTEKAGLLLEGFLLPFPESRTKSAFEKISVRGSIDFPTIHFAGSFNPETRHTELVAGAVSNAPIRLEKTEAFIAASEKDDLDVFTDFAVNEIKEKSKLIKEATISVKVKKDSFQNIRSLLKTLIFA